MAAVYASAYPPSHTPKPDIAKQIESCRDLAARLGYTTTEGTTISDNLPSTDMARPGLSRLVGLVVGEEVQAIIVYTSDRLAKLDSKSFEVITNQLRQRNIPLYIANLPRGYEYDPQTGKLLSDTDEIIEAQAEEWRPPLYPFMRESD